MRLYERFQPVIILGAMILGFLFGQFHFIADRAEPWIVIFLVVMLYGIFLSVPVKHFSQAFKNIRFLSLTTFINFIWTPCLAWVLGGLFLSDSPAVWLGFILLLVTPCTDWYLIFTSIAKGNTALSTSILPVNLILQIILMPVYILIFAGTRGTFEFTNVIVNVVLVLFIPFILAALTRIVLNGGRGIIHSKVIPFFSNAQMIFLFLAVTAMFASHGGILIENLSIIGLIVLPLCLFFVINYFVAQWTGKLFKFSYPNLVSLNMTIIARNSPLALAVVVTVFPDEPLVALVLIIGPLIELPVLFLVSRVLIHSKARM